MDTAALELAFQHEGRYTIQTASAYDLLRTSKKLSFGCPVLDEKTGGGIPFLPLTEISGEAGVGKTQSLLTLALTSLLPVDKGGLDSGCLYISTEGRVPVARLKEYLEARSDFREFLNDD